MQDLHGVWVFYVATGVGGDWLLEHWLSPGAPFNRQFVLVRV
jgi:hypothetical protein